ncbi:hypothetical protein NLJ89_g5236 [Agrocybe chaxingu]|uniref:BZIP domain-containing protein n=1 Tax=Agrocybe chaxingu TaxID=84603 RepID=A0A9W8MTT0_9AGAR|nr:hypothetical protein NLJ89_g5236 [Agrocybe chaxingu]
MTSLGSASSSTTLWATATKEWVIQPKPKPGRKPKKEPAPFSNEPSETDPKGRRVQNRAAQRAFRERKQSQLAELQARIQSYEQGEIERNVALQNVAKRLKEENEALRKENIALQEKLSQIQQQQEELSQQQTAPPTTEKKRWRDDSPSSSSSVQPPAKKKSRTESDTDHITRCQLLSSVAQLPSPSSMVSTPEATDSSESTFNYDTPADLDPGSFGQINCLPSDMKLHESLPSFSSAFSCGFCDGGRNPCMCREMMAQTVLEQTVASAEFKPHTFGEVLIDQPVNEPTPLSPTDINRPSILDNLPAYQPPVPLKRKSRAVSSNSIFPVRAAPARAEATCSGDPSNCLACADDAFGKAFCAAIGSSALNSASCNDCPSRGDGGSAGGCCGGGDGTGCTNCPSGSPTLNSSDFLPEVMPTNTAWQRLKEHPNVAFADLSLLAEVVASRSKCAGPRIILSPAPQLPQDPNTSTINYADRQLEDNRRSPPLRLVPQEVLLECGRRTMRHVHADGVREALRLLDAKFS